MTKLRFLDGTETWSREHDGIAFAAQTGDGARIECIASRDALAALVGKDRSELSAGMAWEVFAAHQARLLLIAQREYARAPRSPLMIAYAEVTP